MNDKGSRVAAAGPLPIPIVVVVLYPQNGGKYIYSRYAQGFVPIVFSANELTAQIQTIVNP